MTIELRLSVVGDFRDVLLLRTVFAGDRRACDFYAESRGFHWLPQPEAGYLLGGYYANANGDCLMPI